MGWKYLKSILRITANCILSTKVENMNSLNLTHHEEHKKLNNSNQHLKYIIFLHSIPQSFCTFISHPSLNKSLMFTKTVVISFQTLGIHGSSSMALYNDGHSLA